MGHGLGNPLLVFAIGLFVGLSHIVLVILASALESVVGIIVECMGQIIMIVWMMCTRGPTLWPLSPIAAIYVYIV